MLNVILRARLQRVVTYYKRQYCKGTFAFFFNPVPINTKTQDLSADKKINKDLILHLEGISLVNFGDERGIKIVEDAISYADQLEGVNTDRVEPLFTVLENEPLYLREDVVEKDVKTNELLSHAEKVSEGYYTTPLGVTVIESDEIKTKSTISDSHNKIDEKIKKPSRI